MICSLKKSRSSSQFAKFCFAAESLEARSSSASSMGYDSITLAYHLSAFCSTQSQSHVYRILPTINRPPPSVVCGLLRRGYRSTRMLFLLDLIRARQIIGMAEFRVLRYRHTFRVLRNLTVSSVFWISGILSFSPTARRCWFCSMNWYFLTTT